MNIITTKVKVAIIDDHPLMRNCLFNCLSIWGYEVIIAAGSTNEFLHQISKENMPAICITDINMPGLDGYETIQILKKNWPSIKIIVYSLCIESGNTDNLNGVGAVISKLDPVALLKNSLQRLASENMSGLDD